MALEQSWYSNSHGTRTVMAPEQSWHQNSQGTRTGKRIVKAPGQSWYQAGWIGTARKQCTVARKARQSANSGQSYNNEFGRPSIMDPSPNPNPNHVTNSLAGHLSWNTSDQATASIMNREPQESCISSHTEMNDSKSKRSAETQQRETPLGGRPNANATAATGDGITMLRISDRVHGRRR